MHQLIHTAELQPAGHHEHKAFRFVVEDDGCFDAGVVRSAHFLDVDADRLVVAFQGEVDAFDFEHLAGGEALVHFAVDGVDDGVHLGVMLCRAHVFDHCFQHRLADVGTNRHR